MTLYDEIKGAKITMPARKERLVVAWHGGPGLRAYDRSGKEVAFWNINHSSEDEVRKSMRMAILRGIKKTYGEG